MNFNAVAKGIVLYFIFIFAAIAILNFNQFSITERTFTFFLVVGIFLIGLYTGKNASESPGLNGFMLGLITSLFIILYVSAYEDLNWELNFMIMVVWISIAIVGAFVGGKLTDFTRIATKELTNLTKKVEKEKPSN